MCIKHVYYNMKRPLLISSIVIAAALLFISIAAFKRYLPYTGRALGPKRTPAIVLAMENTYLVGSNRHGKLWSVKAKKLELARNRSFATLTGITEGKIFDGKKTALKVKAGSAVYDMNGKNLQLGSGVLIEGNSGQKLSGSGAVWNSSTSTLRSIGQVNFETKECKAATDKLMVDIKNKEMSMRNVKISVDINEAEKHLGQEAGNAN